MITNNYTYLQLFSTLSFQTSSHTYQESASLIFTKTNFKISIILLAFGMNGHIYLILNERIKVACELNRSGTEVTCSLSQHY